MRIDTRRTALQLVDIERNRQDLKWGEQNHEPPYWTAILGEEFGEYCEAVYETVLGTGEKAKAKGGFNNMMTELTHVAAVAIGAMECLMREKRHQEELLRLGFGVGCMTCRYHVMTADELQDIGGVDPCIRCNEFCNWEPKGAQP